MQNFDYHIPTDIFFGKDQIKKLGPELKKYTNKILLAYGEKSIKETGLYDQVVKILKENEIEFIEFPGIMSNPTLEKVNEGIKLCKDNNIPFILGVGGGSVIDCIKSIAAGAKYDGDVWDFYSKKCEPKDAIPIASILTLSAAASEMNGGNVVTNTEKKEKLSFVSNVSRPKFSILDPTYTYTVPKYHKAAGIADIMAHTFECYFDKQDSAYLLNSIAESILKTCIKYGPITIKENDYEAHANIMWASSLALNGLIKFGKLGDFACHRMEHPLSGFYNISHGAGLAVLFPNWMEYVYKENINKFIGFANNVWGIEGNDEQTALKGIQATRDFFNSLGLPSTLTELGIKESDFEAMAEKATMFGTLGNFKKIEKKDVVKIYNMSTL